MIFEVEATVEVAVVDDEVAVAEILVVVSMIDTKSELGQQVNINR